MWISWLLLPGLKKTPDWKLLIIDLGPYVPVSTWSTDSPMRGPPLSPWQESSPFFPPAQIMFLVIWTFIGYEIVTWLVLVFPLESVSVLSYYLWKGILSQKLLTITGCLIILPQSAVMDFMKRSDEEYGTLCSCFHSSLGKNIDNINNIYIWKYKGWKPRMFWPQILPWPPGRSSGRQLPPWAPEGWWPGCLNPLSGPPNQPPSGGCVLLYLKSCMNKDSVRSMEV